MSIAAILGILIGAVLGLTGAGGGILAVPALVAAMGWSMQQAAPVALLAVAASAAIGAIDGLRKRLVRWRAALLMAASGMLITPVGTYLAKGLSQNWLQALFALVMLAAAWRMWQQNQGKDGEQLQAICNVSEKTGRFHWTWTTAFFLAGIGAITGLMTGLLGVGGGFVMVPLLRKYSNVSMHGVVATSLAVIALVGGAGVASSIAHGTEVPLGFAALFAAACVAGMLGGRKVIHHLPAKLVQRGFALLLGVIAVGMLGRVVV